MQGLQGFETDARKAKNGHEKNGRPLQPKPPISPDSFAVETRVRQTERDPWPSNRSGCAAPHKNVEGNVSSKLPAIQLRLSVRRMIVNKTEETDKLYLLTAPVSAVLRHVSRPDKIQGRAYLRNEDVQTSTSGCPELHQISRLFSDALGIQRNLSSSGLELLAALSRGFPVRSIQLPVPSSWTNRQPPKWSSVTTHVTSQAPVGWAFDTVKVSDDISP